MTSWVWKICWRRAWQSTPVFLTPESPWTEEPGRLQFMRSQRVEHNWAIKHISGIVAGRGTPSRAWNRALVYHSEMNCPKRHMCWQTRHFPRKRHLGRDQQRKGTQENCSTLWLKASGFMVTGLVSRLLRRDGKNTQKNCTKKISTTQIITMVWSLT